LKYKTKDNKDSKYFTEAMNLIKMVAECFVYLTLEDKLWNLLEISKVKMLELVTWINVILIMNH